ncbi:AraC family transcriptional regulator [Oceanobacillus timonensis]|uniref:AraC family transcriptional regulator n=1 Tax=Oceanobacillus timonensis TaxID=1926285 RepID=UPI001FE85C9A|nr:AraC family transcriptional regulator [Oceanobacillus timonensis]
MNLHRFVSGKKMLNQSVHRLVYNGATFHVHYWGVVPKHYNTSLHKHSFLEICYVIDGKGAYLENDCVYALHKDVMFFSRPKVLHQIQSDEGLALVFVAFELIESESSKEWINIMDKIKRCQQMVIEVQEDTTASLLWKALLIESIKQKNGFSEGMLSNISASLLISLLQIFVPNPRVNGQVDISENFSSILAQAKLFIKDNLVNDLKLSHVANHLHISGRHLSRIFVTELGINFSKFVQKERIKRAAILLKTTDLSIKDIARETGYIDVHYFTRVFTDAMQEPPGRFRALYMDSEKIIYTSD